MTGTREALSMVIESRVGVGVWDGARLRVRVLLRVGVRFGLELG